VAGENAEYELDGNTYYSNSNTIDDRLTDVVFTLEAVTTDPTTLNITANSSDAKENISDFVEKYNEVLTELHTLINDEEGVLYNDSGLKDIFNSIRRIPNEIVKGTGSSYTTLSSIGITTGSSATATSDDYFGLLEIDEDTLTAALNDDAKGVSNLFFFDPKGGANFTSGIGNSFEERLSPLTSATGTLNARTTLMTESMDNLLKRITDRESSLKLKEDNLKRTYVNLEVMMGQLSRQGEWLSQQLSGLGSFGG
jgi:flagellar hook-associated protein 2